MLTLEYEIQRVRHILGDRVAALLIARDHREVFSVYPEIRTCAWLGALLIAAAAGVVLKDHVDAIGPLGLVVILGAATAACYAFVASRRRRNASSSSVPPSSPLRGTPRNSEERRGTSEAPRGTSLLDDYILLLGALLLSATAALIEAQFDLFGEAWPRHFALLAIVHGVTAYLFGSRLVLSLSIVALAAWIGVAQHSGLDAKELATRAFVCAALLLIWRALDRRLADTPFASLFEHFAAHVALIGGGALLFDDATRTVGMLATVAIAAVAIAWGFRTRREAFVLYAFVYAVVAIDVFLIELAGSNQQLGMLIVVTSMIAAIMVLFALHSRFRGADA